MSHAKENPPELPQATTPPYAGMAWAHSTAQAVQLLRAQQAMNERMTTGEYEAQAMRTEADQGKILERLATLGPKAMRLDNAARGLCSDAGEVAAVVMKHIEYGRDLDEVNLLEECGDVLWRLTQVLLAAGFTLADAMEANIRKLSLRYPDKYTDEASANRDRKGEAEAVAGGVRQLAEEAARERAQRAEAVMARNALVQANKGTLEASTVKACVWCGGSGKKLDRAGAEHNCTICGGKGSKVGDMVSEAKPAPVLVQDGHGFGHAEGVEVMEKMTQSQRKRLNSGAITVEEIRDEINAEAERKQNHLPTFCHAEEPCPSKHGKGHTWVRNTTNEGTDEVCHYCGCRRGAE